MKFTARRAAAMICAGAIAMSIVAMPVAAAEVSATNVSASASTTEVPSPPIYSAFHGHGTVA
jgi:hypothetical protein